MEASAAEAGGRSLPILVPGEGGRLVLDEAALRSVLLQDGVRHLPVVVVAVAGAFRKGKSFLVSLLLRFLERGGSVNWQGAPDEPLTGFEWRGGRQPHTVGIHMWSRPARLSLPSGEEVAVVLMDTQGTFDNSTVLAENAAIFALSALMSSVQIYNVSGSVGTDDLQHLQLFSEFGRVAAESGRGSGFQRLLFLVRDWQHLSDAPCGSVGGRIVLRDLLSSSPGTPEELRLMRQHVRQCFSDIDCFLLPHPGKKVATSPEFTGCPRDIDADFLEGVDGLARLLFSPRRLLKKESAGEALTAADLVTHFTSLHAALASGRMPEPRSLVNTMSEANHLASVSRGSIQYAEQMRPICDEHAPGVPEDELRRHHETVLKRVIDDFDNKKRMLGEQGTHYKQQMLDAIESWWSQFSHANQMKNELSDARDGLCCNQAVVEARDNHRRRLNDLLGRTDGAVDAARLREENARSSDDALRTFDTRTADCSRQQLVNDRRNQLRAQLDNVYEEADLFNGQRREGQAGAEADRVALEQARQQYRSIMDECMMGGPLPEREFADRQRNAEHRARQTFMTNRGETYHGAQRVDQHFNRQIREEGDSLEITNVLRLLSEQLLPVIGGLVTKAITKCVVM